MHTRPNPSWKIPNGLNITLVLIVSPLLLFLLWLGNHYVEQPLVLTLLGIGYAYLSLTNYSLMHEAAHDKLHSSTTVNYIAGMFASFFFPMSITLLQNTHTKHHNQNRSDDELFDAYTEGDSLVKKYIQWYAILIGVFWFYPVLGSVALALFSPKLVQKWFLEDRPGRAYTANFTPREVRRMRIELAMFALFAMMIIYGLDISPVVILLYYALFAFNWSTRQFIEHAYTRLHLTEGAHNLKHFPWMSWLYLNRELDLNHHRYPSVPWNHLPDLLTPGEQRIHYVRQYLRLWSGPVPLSTLEHEDREDTIPEPLS
ncbi:MAG: fatty acid desaturase [Candidatus Thiodiazotropha sp. (ex. Lucinisca nassula)]|nr:fatty acid desaturase [Candidatus Thiodiazotropha sp. (ex. Lucinisca nassula)]MBW9274621.1 fatty acid desaturase [Candidatus Thiodiazotropha sp. (ex. Lucinisca nassula)]